MEHIVRIYKNGQFVEEKAQHGSNLLGFLREKSVVVSAPCGGSGTCGKCRVRISGQLEKPSDKEKGLLGTSAVEKGYRLACYCSIDSDIDVYVSETSDEANIMTSGKERVIELEPPVYKKYIEMNVPNIHDQAADMDRVLSFINSVVPVRSLKLLRELPDIIRQNDFKATLVYMENELIAVEPGNTADRLYGVAVDIGTTTIAAYLYNLVSGEKLDVYSVLNPQKKFGADVLSRIEYSIKSPSASDEMNNVIISCINEIVRYFTSRNSLTKSDIYSIVLVGNTTMMHFLMNVTARNIAASPFVPATTLLHRFGTEEMGIDINPYGCAILFPCVSGYIGADTVAAVLSSGMYNDDEISLLIDIGTNGEIVLGNKEWLYSCSTAAGPAFEGANIRNGVGGVKGAIDSIHLDAGRVEYTTIGNEKAVGICGSGIVDAIASMVNASIIDETGRIMDSDENVGLSDDLGKRIIDIDGVRAFLMLKSQECNSDVDIAVTQKDIREIQNAKAAIAAGIKTLVKRAGINMNDVSRVYLAGGFGSYINKDSALAIGLIPSELKGKIQSIGNSAGAGAIEGLLSEKMLKETEKIKSMIKYVELSASPEFVEEYVECMMF